MLNSIRKFSKTFLAKILLILIIIPFVFWGMGSSFQGGSKNTVAKVNKYSISTKEFIQHIESLNMDTEIIRKNINNSVVEQLLSDLINKIVLSLESKSLNIILSNKDLSEIIKKDKNFLDENNLFSRTKYEKFLITNNISAALYERNLSKELTGKFLFNYVSGGTFPPNFLVKNTYDYQNKKVNVKALNLNSTYKKEKDFDKKNINKFIEENQEKLKRDFVSFRFSIINPETLINSNDFNKLFFQKIDEIENSIINDTSYDDIVKEYNLNTNDINLIDKKIKNYNSITQKNINPKLVDEIFKLTDKNPGKVHLVEYENQYALLTIDEIKNLLPSLTSQSFKKKIVKALINKDVFEKNTKLIEKIKTNKITYEDFKTISKNNKIKIDSILINGIRDNNSFSKESNNKIYKTKVNDFTIVHEIKKNENYLVWIEKINNPIFNKKVDNYNKYYNETVIGLKNNIYASYDEYINQKYNVEINYQTLDRIKNSFR